MIQPEDDRLELDTIAITLVQEQKQDIGLAESGKNETEKTLRESRSE